MGSRFRKIPFALSWIILPGLLFFLIYLITRASFCFYIMGSHPGTLSIVIALAVLIALYLIFRNIELTIITFISIHVAFIVVAGMGYFFEIGRNVSVPWILLYGFDLFLGSLIMYALHHDLKWTIWSSAANFQFIFLIMLVIGFLLIILASPWGIKVLGLVFTGMATLFFYTVYFQRIFYQQFFCKRIARGMHPLTFLQIIQTLWTYFILVLGSVLLGFLGVMVYALWFTDIEWRKRIFHYMVMYYSRFFIWIIPIWLRFINELGEDFRKPAVIISNHQSLIDTTLLFRLSPKAIILTNDWVYNSPVFGHISKLADFYNVSAGIDQIFEKLRGRVEEGYSILVFPEGTRSRTETIERFHRGAFYIAEKLEMDILPILFYGTGEVLKKEEFWGKGNAVCQKILPRIEIQDRNYGENYSKRAKYVRRYMVKEYEQLNKECYSSTSKG